MGEFLTRKSFFRLSASANSYMGSALEIKGKSHHVPLRFALCKPRVSMSLE